MGGFFWFTVADSYGYWPWRNKKTQPIAEFCCLVQIDINLVTAMTTSRHN